LRLGGFYTFIAQWITRLCHRPRQFLLISMAVAAFLSALLANDIVCLAFTPVLTYALIQARMNPFPFLLGLAVASNIGSAATLIGNPQNMLIGQTGRLSFAAFSLWCLPTVILSFFGGYAILVRAYRHRWLLLSKIDPTQDPVAWPAFNLGQSVKGLVAVLAAVGLFFTPIPREISAVAIAGVLMCSRKLPSRKIVELVDWHLLTLFCALFVVIQGIETVQVPQYLVGILTRQGVDVQHPWVLTGLSTVLSNLVSNVPAVMLLIRFLDATQPVQWYLLALTSTFAGNLITIGSIANLIVIEQAKTYGVDIDFKTHARIGVPVTVWSLVVVGLQIDFFAK
jgi:Na+/H+ antiporter NhaD/arsenite permease-like protein